MNELFWIFVLRFGQVLLLGLPGALCGVCIAACVGTWFPVPAAPLKFRAVLRSRAVLLLLPMTAFGSLFVAERLRRSGAPRTLILLVLLSAATVPWSIAWGAGKSGVPALAPTLAAALLVSVIVPWLTIRVTRRDDATADFDSNVTGTRLIDLLRAAADSVRPGVIACVLIAAAGSAAATLPIPPGYLEEHLGERKLAAFVLAHGVALAAVATPEDAMLFAWQAHLINAVPGTAVAWLVLGSFASAGAFVFVTRHFGVKTAAVFLLTLGVLTFAGSAIVDRLTFTATALDTDTHAFDVLGHPWHLGENDGTGPRATTIRLWKMILFPDRYSWLSPALASTAVILSIGVFGQLDRRRDRAAASTEKTPTMLSLPTRYTFVGLAFGAWSLYGLYVYFPSIDISKPEILSLDAVSSVALRMGSPEAPAAFDRLDDVMYRTTVGERLRFRNAELVASLTTLRGKLREMRVTITPDRPAERDAALLAFTRELKKSIR